MALKSARIRSGGDLTFRFIKSPHFRTIHVDGIFGGPAPNGRAINAALFSERSPVPDEVTHTVSNLGVLGNEDMAKRTGATGVLRELEVNLSFDLETAISIRDWFDQKISELQTLADLRVEALKKIEAKNV